MKLRLKSHVVTLSSTLTILTSCPINNFHHFFQVVLVKKPFPGLEVTADQLFTYFPLSILLRSLFQLCLVDKYINYPAFPFALIISQLFLCSDQPAERQFCTSQNSASWSQPRANRRLPNSRGRTTGNKFTYYFTLGLTCAQEWCVVLSKCTFTTLEVAEDIIKANWLTSAGHPSLPGHNLGQLLGRPCQEKGCLIWQETPAALSLLQKAWKGEKPAKRRGTRMLDMDTEPVLTIFVHILNRYGMWWAPWSQHWLGLFLSSCKHVLLLFLKGI